MYLLNNRKEEYTEGLTIAKIIEMKTFTYKKIIVTVNDEFVELEDYEQTKVNKGDDVKIHHLLAGG